MGAGVRLVSSWANGLQRKTELAWLALRGALGLTPSREEGRAAAWKRKWATQERTGVGQKQRKEKEFVLFFSNFFPKQF